MTHDWARLARAIRDTRNALGWRQDDLAERAEIGLSTVQALEGGKAYTRIPPSIGAIERAFEWPAGSGRRVLEGGDPPPPAAEAAPGRTAPTLSAGLPTRVIRELSREVLDTDVIDLSRPGSSTRMVVVITRDEGTPDDAQLQEDLEEWVRVQRHLRRIAAGDESSD